MKRKAFAALGIVGALALLVGVFPFSSGGGASAAGPERFLIFTNGDAPVNERAREALEGRGGRTLSVMHITPGLDLIDVLVPAPAGELLGQIARLPGVLEISPDQPPELLDSPELQWGVDRIDADLVWSAAGQAGIGSPSPREASVTGGVTGVGIRIAVVDTGVDPSHPDLSPNLATGANCIDTADDACSEALPTGDGQGHGSHVAGIAAAADNAIGVIGVAPGATLVPVKIFDDTGASTFASVVNGIRYVAGTDGSPAVSRRADVMNMSFGWSKNLAKQCSSCVVTLQTVVNEAWNAGVVPVAAAGNSGNKNGSGDNAGYPARLNNVVAVAATDSADKRASFSSTGPAVDIAAPGVGIYSTYKNGAYATLSGTSMASPHVAGAAGLVIQATGAGWTPAGVVSALVGTADDLGASGFDTKFGWGLLDAQQAATGVASTP